MDDALRNWVLDACIIPALEATGLTRAARLLRSRKNPEGDLWEHLYRIPVPRRRDRAAVWSALCQLDALLPPYPAPRAADSVLASAVNAVINAGCLNEEAIMISAHQHLVRWGRLRKRDVESLRILRNEQRSRDVLYSMVGNHRIDPPCSVLSMVKRYFGIQR